MVRKKPHFLRRERARNGAPGTMSAPVEPFGFVVTLAPGRNNSVHILTCQSAEGRGQEAVSLSCG